MKFSKKLITSIGALALFGTVANAMADESFLDDRSGIEFKYGKQEICVTHVYDKGTLIAESYDCNGGFDRIYAYNEDGRPVNDDILAIMSYARVNRAKEIIHSGINKILGKHSVDHYSWSEKGLFLGKEYGSIELLKDDLILSDLEIVRPSGIICKYSIDGKCL